MTVMEDWINPIYLQSRVANDIRETIRAKPIAKYTVLDNFFKSDKLDALIEVHKTLEFSEEVDRVAPNEPDFLPYDSEVVFAEQENFGSELFFDEEWHRYCCYLTDTNLPFPVGTEIKLRWHRPNSDGFWIHTDANIRSLVIIAYFNKFWKASDGGLLQLWLMEDGTLDSINFEKTTSITTAPNGRLDCLVQQEEHTPKRIYTTLPGGGFPDEKGHHLVLIDQIVPVYNRVFICNFQDNPTYHSVTPSRGKERTGFVQWLFDKRTRA